MACVYLNDNGNFIPSFMYWNDNSVIKTEDDIDIFVNNGGEKFLMPHKEKMLLNLDGFSFKTKSCADKNFMITKTFTLKVLNTVKTNFADNQTTTGDFGNYTVATNNGVLWLPKAQNQHNITLAENLFENTQRATISMTFQANSFNNQNGFMFMLDTLNLGIGNVWSPWRVSIRKGSSDLAVGAGVTEGRIYNFTLVIEDGTYTLYKNASHYATVSGQSNLATCNKIWLNGFTSHSGTFCNIGISSIRVWKDVALTSDEVRSAAKFDFRIQDNF